MIATITELYDIVIWVAEIERLLRSENVSSSQLEQSHGGRVWFDSCYRHVLDKQREPLDQSRLIWLAQECWEPTPRKPRFGERWRIWSVTPSCLGKSRKIQQARRETGFLSTLVSKISIFSSQQYSCCTCNFLLEKKLKEAVCVCHCPPTLPPPWHWRLDPRKHWGTSQALFIFLFWARVWQSCSGWPRHVILLTHSVG